MSYRAITVEKSRVDGFSSQSERKWRYSAQGLSVKAELPWDEEPCLSTLQC